MKIRIAAAAAALALLGAPAFADGDAEAGAKVFNKCKACHMVGEDAKNRIGPELNDLFGRVAGSVEGYNYSKAMEQKRDEGLVWNEETLTPWLEKPRDYIKGTKMTFAGLRDEQDIEDVLAYLKTFSTSDGG